MPAKKKKNTKKKTVSKVPAKSSPAEVKNKTGVMPLADRVLIRPLSSDERTTATSFGIVIPETAEKEKPEQGEVVAVGEGKYVDGMLIVPRVKVGDRVVFSRYGYDEIKVGGVEYFILKEDNILAIINEK